MKAQITVQASSDREQAGGPVHCLVTIVEGASQTQHTVTIEKAYRDKLAGPEITIEQLVRKSFEFLLEREPKESILRSFDLRVIGRYFPEYEKEIHRMLGTENRG